MIDREWIQAGFPFETRHNHSCYATPHARSKEAGSTFVLFLDCVYQLHCQFPCSFEFGTNLLVILFEHSYSSQYGTFLADCERQRDAIRLHKKTTSLWSYLNRPDVLKSLLNPIYEPNQSVIWPSVAPISLVLWSGKYSILSFSIEIFRLSILSYTHTHRFVPAMGHRSKSHQKCTEPNFGVDNARKRIAPKGNTIAQRITGHDRWTLVDIHVFIILRHPISTSSLRPRIWRRRRRCFQVSRDDFLYFLARLCDPRRVVECKKVRAKYFKFYQKFKFTTFYLYI